MPSSAKMNLSNFFVIALCCFVAGCSERKPVHPDVGLSVYSRGAEAAKCGLFMSETLDGPPGKLLKLTPNSMKFAEADHEVSVRWEPDLGGAVDHFDLSISADGMTWKQRVAYNGNPIVLVEKPFRVVMEKVDFSKTKAEPAAPSDGSKPSN